MRYVVLPTKGKPTAARRQVENRRAFRKMVRWRTGCEGRISCAKRDFGLNRTRIDGLDGARTWCGHGIFAHNLVKISGLIDRPNGHATIESAKPARATTINVPARVHNAASHRQAQQGSSGRSSYFDLKKSW